MIHGSRGTSARGMAQGKANALVTGVLGHKIQRLFGLRRIEFVCILWRRLSSLRRADKNVCPTSRQPKSFGYSFT